MGYMHIDNLYKDQRILMFKECYAMEKIHGTSAHISWRDGQVHLFSGGEKYERFVQIFDLVKLTDAFAALGYDPRADAPSVTIFGEAYGGKCQGMSHTYGKDLKFVAFDVKIGGSDDDHGTWLSVPDAAEVCGKLGLDFVHYDRCSATVEALDLWRDADSVQACKNGCGFGHSREGIVIRPIDEFRDKRGNRIICKHKGDKFKETATPRQVVDPAKQVVLEEAEAIADEWVTDERLRHVLDKLPEDKRDMSNMQGIIAAMSEDVLREGSGEIKLTDFNRKEFYKVVGAHTAKLMKQLARKSLDKSHES